MWVLFVCICSALVRCVICVVCIAYVVTFYGVRAVCVDYIAFVERCVCVFICVVCVVCSVIVVWRVCVCYPCWTILYLQYAVYVLSVLPSLSVL